VTVIVQPRSVYVAITGETGPASMHGYPSLHRQPRNSHARHKRRKNTQGIVSRKRKGAAVYLRLFGYDDEDGLKNQVPYLPSEKLQIALKR
jgi:hypothetical protein